MPLRKLAFSALLAALLAAVLAAGALAAPLAGSGYDDGNGTQVGAGDWQGAAAAGLVKPAFDPETNDNCFIGGVKENTPNAWAFNTASSGCVPGKSDILAAWANTEATAATTFTHMAFWRNANSGNTFLAFELNQSPNNWTNSVGTTIPCRTNGDLLLSYEVGGSSLTVVVYQWTGDGTGPVSCPNGANGSFTSSGTITTSYVQGAMNAANITNYLNPATIDSMFGSLEPANGTFATNTFGEGGLNLPAVLTGMGDGPCFGYLRMHVHSRSASSISSSLIDYVSPIPVIIQSCSVSGTVYADANGNGVNDHGETNAGAGWQVYADLNNNGTLDAGEPTATTDASGAYHLATGVPTGGTPIRLVLPSSYSCTAPSPCSYAPTWVAGGNSSGNDFEVYQPPTANGVVYHDTNGNGVQDTGETGLLGRTVFADYNANGTQDFGEPSTTTAADGSWSLGQVRAGTYPIVASAPSGWRCSGGCSVSTTFSTGATSVAVGEWQVGSISGSAFGDLNANGAKDLGETGLSGQTVYIDASGSGGYTLGDATAVTAPDGTFNFASLAPGTYTVGLLPASGWTCSVPTSCTSTVTVGSGQSKTAAAFGVYQGGTVAGSVYIDSNANGVQNLGDGGLSGQTVYVDLNGNGQQDTGEPSTTTANDGTYSITAVKPGTYTVREVPSSGWLCSTANSCQASATVTSGGTSSAGAFGNYQLAGVSGTVTNDLNANGAADGGEPGLGGQTVFADLNGNGKLDSAEPSATTAGDGSFSVGSLPPGTYKLTLAPGSGWTCSLPASCEQDVTLSSGQSQTGEAFAAWQPGSVIGSVFGDANANGIQDLGENGLGGQTVYVDLNGNGQKDTGEPSATAAADGSYTISGVTPGSYTVREVPGTGWLCSTANSCEASTTVPSGGAPTVAAFGNFQLASISGTVSNDLNANGAVDSGEPGLGGQTVFADLNGNGKLDGGEPSATTAGDGSFSITGLTPGTYKLTLAPASGWTCSLPASCERDVTLSSGQSQSGEAFAVWQLGSVSGSVFGDGNANGTQDSGDTGLSGQAVYVDLNGNGQLDTGEPSATTAGDGSYTITGVTPGSYTVRQTLGSGWFCSTANSCQAPATVTSGGSPGVAAFGNYQQASVSGTVTNDLNANGAVDSGEPGLGGQTVFADLNGNGKLDSGEPSATTASDGSFSITGLTPGAYKLTLAPASGWTCSLPASCEQDVTLSSGQSQAGETFAAWQAGSVSGSVFGDANSNGTQDTGENGLGGQTVYVDLNGNGQLDPGEPSATTGGDGSYTITGVKPGSYTVAELLGGGWFCSTSNSCHAPVTVTSGGSHSVAAFGNYGLAGVSGTVTNDLNANGTRDLGEPGLGGQTVFADLNGNGRFDAGEPHTTTASDGSFSIGSLTPGTYKLTLAPGSNWTCSLPASCERDVTLTSGQSQTGEAFAAWQPGSVSGSVFGDGNANGTQDSGENGLGGQTVYVDLNGNGQPDPGEPSAVSAPDGSYSIDGLTPGSYTVREEPASGWTCSAPAGCAAAITVGSGSPASGPAFGDYQDATVSGTVSEDLNANGIVDSAEPGLGGQTVFVDLNGNGQLDAGEPSATTAADGSYSIGSLVPGSYTVLLVSSGGMTCSVPSPCQRALTLASGQSRGGQDFAEWQNGSASGVVFTDANANGSHDTGEPGLGGQTVYADLNGNGSMDPGEPSATTGPDGSYTITGLNPGDYQIRLDTPTGSTCSTPAGCESDATVVSGQSAGGPAFGMWSPASVSGTVFADANGNGAQDAGETPLGGQTVFVDLQNTGTPVPGDPTATTAADGTYTISGLKPGDYRVLVSTPTGWTCTAPSPCQGSERLSSGQRVNGVDFGLQAPAVVPNPPSNPGSGSGSGPGSTPTPTPTTPAPDTPAPAAPVRSSVDATPSAKSSVSGTLFEDYNANGTRDTGELPVPGATVYIDLNGNGVRDAGEPAQTTGTDGTYSFQIDPGTYTVHAQWPSSKWVCSSPSATCARQVVVGGGQARSGQDLGAWRKSKLSGIKFEDVRGTGGDFARGDVPLAGWRIYVDLNSSRSWDGPAGARPRSVHAAVSRASDGMPDEGEPSAISGADGHYTITNIPAGTYTVREVPPAGSSFRCSYPVTCSYRVTFHDGDSKQLDFGSVAGARAAVLADPSNACQSRNFMARVTVTGTASQVMLSIDGRRTMVSKHFDGLHRYSFQVPAGAATRGVHRLAARVFFYEGGVQTLRGVFYRCGTVVPSSTG